MVLMGGTGPREVLTEYCEETGAGDCRSRDGRIWGWKFRLGSETEPGQKQKQE